MGAGASAGVTAAVDGASEDELRLAFSLLGAGGRARLGTALSEGAAPEPPAGDGGGAAGAGTEAESGPAALAVPDVPLPVSVPPPEFYLSPETVYAQLAPPEEGKPAPVKLLNSEWLLARADAIVAATTDAERERLALPRRQGLERMHPEAYLSADEVRRMPTSSTGALLVGAVSYAWLTVCHPDPRGEQLVRLASMLRKAQRGELRRQQEDWGQANSISAYKKLPARVALFMDWVSLCQAQKAADGSVEIARTEDEEAAFRGALDSMQLWYVHQRLFTILVTELPERCAGTVAPYDARGWTTVERAWAMVATPNANSSWPMLYDAGAGEEAARFAPLHPEQVAEALATKKFTSPKADLPLVLRLYNETILSVLGGATELNFNNSGWQPRDGVNFARVFCFCSRAKVIYIINNRIGDEGCTAIAEATRQQGALPELRVLAVAGNDVGDAGCLALAAAVRAGAMPELERLSFHYSSEPNRAGDAARAELRAACQSRGMNCDSI